MKQQFHHYDSTLINNSLSLFDSLSLNVSNQGLFNSSLQLNNSEDSRHGSNSLAPVHGAAKYICLAIYGLILLFALYGNSIVFYVLGYRKKKRNQGDFLVLSLAGTDLLASLVVAAFMLNDIITDFSSWIYGEILCHVFSAVVPMTMCASGWLLALISIDRYRIVSTPMAREPHRSVLLLSISFVWLSSIGAILPLNFQIEAGSNVCWSTNYDILGKQSAFPYVVLWVGYSMFIPNSIIFIVYCLTARALKHNTVIHDNHRAMEQRNKQNGRIVRMFIIIVVASFLLTIPYAIFCLYASYVIGYDVSNPNGNMINNLNYVLLIPVSTSYCVNPLIYAKMHREINGYLKSAIRRITTLCCHCVPITAEITSTSSVNRSFPLTTGGQSKI